MLIIYTKRLQTLWKIGSLWLHVPSDIKMVSSAMTTWYNNNGLQTRVILDFVDKTLDGGQIMTYYTLAKKKH